MSKSELKELYVQELRDLFDAETRMVKTLPKMANAAQSSELRAGFEQHLKQTKAHVDRLRKIFVALNLVPDGKKCVAIAGLLQEGEDIIDRDFPEQVMDAALISAAQRVEHYEIAAYGCVKTWAGLLGENAAQNLLEQTLREENEADKKLKQLSLEINLEATAGDDLDGEMEAEVPAKTLLRARAVGRGI